MRHKKIIGLENKYNKTIEKLDKYYRDNDKVIQACTAEVRSHPQVQYFDFKGLLSLKICLENNYTRLKSRELGYEMSNSHKMDYILKKCPIQEK